MALLQLLFVGTVAILSFLVGAGLKPYFSGYAKKKGENLATHEDIDKLVEQVRAVTTTTKEIEAKISGDIWDRQKRWELKREVLFEAIRRLADAEDGLLSLDSVLQVERRESKEADPTWPEARYQQTKKWGDASAAFDETRLLVNMACQKETAAAVDAFGSLINQVAVKISPGGDWEIYRKSFPDREKKRIAVQTAVRKELGIE